MAERAESERADNAPVQAPARQQKRRRKIILFCVVSVVNVGLLALILTQLLTPTSNKVADPLVGHPAPGFSLAVASAASGPSATLSLADFKGKPVVLNFWATWCAPCKEEMPLLERTSQQVQTQGKDVVFLGIDFQESGSDVAPFLQQYKITYPIALDEDGAAALKYGITALPQTVFINRQGTVVSRVPGELTAQSLASNLQLIEKP